MLAGVGVPNGNGGSAGRWARKHGSRPGRIEFDGPEPGAVIGLVPKGMEQLPLGRRYDLGRIAGVGHGQSGGGLGSLLCSGIPFRRRIGLQKGKGRDRATVGIEPV